MATLTEKLPENIPGRYYVDASCIDCDQCRALSPEIFARNDDKGVSYVVRQPATSEEINQVEDIISTCATSSIGNDGA